MKLEDEMELPRVKWENYRHSAKAGIGKATVKFSGRKESAVGANAEYQVVAGEKENIQVRLQCAANNFCLCNWQCHLGRSMQFNKFHPKCTITVDSG